MDISKTFWNNSEKKVNISFPIAKVNKEKRTVSGFASLDNIDRHGDIVTSDASKKAFERFRGNLREMHQPIAVGKVMSFTTKEFIDPETNKAYNGIYVDAYISKGAQDTWEKVLDGTLTGFSIGGNIVEASYEPGDKEDNRVIKDYELMELSLVDNPANPLANIFSIQKNADGMIMKGMAAELEIENVFYCEGDQIATTAAADINNCMACGSEMKTIGWVEKSDVQKGDSIMKAVASYFTKDDAPGPTHEATTHEAEGTIDSEETINLYPDQNKFKKDELSVGDYVKWNSSGGTAYGKIVKIVREGSYKVPDSSFEIKGTKEDPAAAIRLYKKTEKGYVPTDKMVGHKLSTLSKANVSVKKSENENTISKGGNEEMADETNEVEATPVEVVEEFAEAPEAVDGDSVEKAATVSEVPVDELDFVKMVGSLKEDVTETISKNYAEHAATIADMYAAVESIKKSIDDFGGKSTELSNNVADVVKRIDDLEKRVNEFEGATAVRKSVEAEVAADETKITKSIWQGHFLGVSNL